MSKNIGANNGNWQGGKRRDRRARNERYADPYYEQVAQNLRERAQTLIADGYLSSNYSDACWNLALVEKVIQAAENIKATSLNDGVSPIIARLNVLRSEYSKAPMYKWDEIRIEISELTNYLQRIGVEVI